MFGAYFGNTQSSVPFIVEIDTTHPGSGSTQINLPFYDLYDAIIDWGDGNNQTISGGTVSSVTTISHVYSSSGTYNISITGDWKGLKYANGGDKSKLVNIRNWGNYVFSTNENFYGCNNLVITASDVPSIDTSANTVLNATFRNCTALNAVPSINSWDFVGVTNVSRFFSGSAFNQNMNSTNMNTVVNSSNMYTSTPFNHPINGMQWNNLTNTEGMFSFSSFNQDVSSISMGSVTTIREMFSNTPIDQSFASFDITSVTNATNFLSSSNISSANYDATLISWSGQAINTGLSINFGTSQYTASEVDSGTNTGTGTTLTEVGQDFLTTVSVGDVVFNINTSSYARVVTVVDDENLTLDTSIMSSSDTYSIQSSNAAKSKAALILDKSTTIIDGGYV